MTLLRTRHHLTTLLGAVVDWNLLTRCVTQELAGRLLHVPGGAGGLVVVSALLLPLLTLRTLSHQGIVTVEESVVLNNLFVRDAAVLLIVLVTNLQPAMNKILNIQFHICILYFILFTTIIMLPTHLFSNRHKLRGVGVVTLLHRLVNTREHWIFPGIMSLRNY